MVARTRSRIRCRCQSEKENNLIFPDLAGTFQKGRRSGRWRAQEYRCKDYKGTKEWKTMHWFCTLSDEGFKMLAYTLEGSPHQ